ncbi:type II and III secretion system protein family protein [Phenylobacterium sp.]|uniref:type II and III secretion system protein family protein n=1 Tax=Phenylobacterium sp. TaxID=1871053 RepID=UPI0035B1884B
MKSRALAAAFAAAALLAPATQARAAAEVVAGQETQLALEVGKGRLMRLTRPAATVFIADPKIADVQVKSPTLVYVIGKAPGATSFFALDAKEESIANLAISVGYDHARLQQMLRQQVPGAEVQVAAANGALILTGKVASAAEGDDVLRIASLFVQADEKAGASPIINRLTVEAPNQINLRVRVAEVSRDATRQLGFNWETAVQVGEGGVLGFATGTDFFPEPGVINRPPNGVGAIAGGLFDPDSGLNLNVLIEALEQKNQLTVLAEPNLTAVSGEPASFLAGGEFPIPVSQGPDQITVSYKQFGISLNFVATILDGGRISLNVRPEVSQLSQAGAVTVEGLTVPALTTRRAETTVELGSGQSFAIAGLIQNQMSKEVRQLPGFGDIPVLGELFRSKRFQRNESELVIIVTPYLVKPVSQRLAAPTDPPRPKAAAAAAAEPPARKEG